MRRGNEKKGTERKEKGKREKEEARLMDVHCLRMIQSKLTSHQPCHQQKLTKEKDERR